MENKTYTMDFAGYPLSFNFGHYAEQADGSVLVRMGDTAVLVNVCASDTPREGVDFFPLAVDFEEKQYAVGKIPGGFIKREGRPTEKATLTCRLIDRPLRPLFPKGMRNDVQVVATALSVDAGLFHRPVRQRYPLGGPHGFRACGHGRWQVRPDAQ